jgi:hypothetical protein
MNRRNFLTAVAACPVAGIAAITPEHTILARPEVRVVGSNKSEIIVECSTKLFVNGRQVSLKDLEIIGRHAQLGLCRIKEIVVESAVRE